MKGKCLRPIGCICRPEERPCAYWHSEGEKPYHGMKPPRITPPAKAADNPDPFGGEDDILKVLHKVNSERAGQYGTPEDNFARIARHWTVYFLNRYGLDVAVTPTDVALLMDLMKTARLENMPGHRDSWVDKAGYARCGAAIEANLARLGRKNAV